MKVPLFLVLLSGIVGLNNGAKIGRSPPLIYAQVEDNYEEPQTDQRSFRKPSLRNAKFQEDQEYEDIENQKITPTTENYPYTIIPKDLLQIIQQQRNQKQATINPKKQPIVEQYLKEVTPTTKTLYGERTINYIRANPSHSQRLKESKEEIVNDQQPLQAQEQLHLQQQPQTQPLHQRQVFQYVFQHQNPHTKPILLNKPALLSRPQPQHLQYQPHPSQIQLTAPPQVQLQQPQQFQIQPQPEKSEIPVHDHEADEQDKLAQAKLISEQQQNDNSIKSIPNSFLPLTIHKAFIPPDKLNEDYIATTIYIPKNKKIARKFKTKTIEDGSYLQGENLSSNRKEEKREELDQVTRQKLFELQQQLAKHNRLVASRSRRIKPELIEVPQNPSPVTYENPNARYDQINIPKKIYREPKIRYEQVLENENEQPIIYQDSRQLIRPLPLQPAPATSVIYSVKRNRISQDRQPQKPEEVQQQRQILMYQLQFPAESQNQQIVQLPQQILLNGKRYQPILLRHIPALCRDNVHVQGHAGIVQNVIRNPPTAPEEQNVNYEQQ